MIKKALMGRSALVVAVGLLVANAAAFAVDPTLADVSGSFATYVTEILTFIVAIVGAFILASLVPMGFRKLWSYVKRLIGLA